MSDGGLAATMMSSLEAAEFEARAAEKSLREAEERMMRLSKVSATTTIPATTTGCDDAHCDESKKEKAHNYPIANDCGVTGYGATAKDEEKGDDDDDDEPKEKKEPNDPFADGFGPYLSHSLDELFNPWKSPMNWLLLCTPFAYYGHHHGWDDVTVFILSVLAIAPMAERVSFVTEQLAMHTSETIGGLLNATFGNVTELIVSLVALFGGMLRIVQVSLLGSILSNLLLVLGCAFFVGGLKYPEQKYSHKAQTLSFSLLLLAVLCIAMPTVLEITHDVEYPEHSSLDRVLGVSGAIFWLAMITVGISLLSEWLVDAIRGAADGLGVPDLFLGTIIIPIVGNAAEHAAAIIFAAKNKMELSLGIAVGSATQIALFV
ncbi:vacuolar cation proton exchanger 2-like protein, partial [Chrysochromulina tobinii]